jgi:hypothetical protein
MRTFASEILSARDINFNFDFDKNLLRPNENGCKKKFLPHL